MRLLIISHTAHYSSNERIVGWGPTVREINHLGRLFDDVRHIAFLHSGEAPKGSLPYEAPNVHLVPVPPSGGPRWINKLEILRFAPMYIQTILSHLKEADVVHVRCPANISLLAIILLGLVSKPRARWVKYAGNWKPSRPDAWSYRFQRWWLNHGWHRGLVTVNGQWSGQPQHVVSFYNPSLSDREILDARRDAVHKQLTTPIRLLYVGRLEEEKGVGRAIRILAAVNRGGIPAVLDLVGDGPQRQSFEKLAAELSVEPWVRFHGWLPRPQLPPIYNEAHFLLFPCTSSEGWPKVLSEAMAYGAVPIAGMISSIPQYLDRFQSGVALDPMAIDSFVQAIGSYFMQPAQWRQHSMNGVKSAHFFAYSSYLHEVQTLLKLSKKAPLTCEILDDTSLEASRRSG